MASARKKLDEKNVKFLRELVSLAENKYCFDCHQRGPTYVNVTIGSFVCTSCSGLLRGLTPPHRVKSISMATFSPEEIQQLKSQGNEYCRKVWLGLYDNNSSVISPKDEQQIKEFMISKYERKRFYLKPEENDNITMNGTNKSTTPMNNQKLATSVTFPVIPSYNCVTNNNCNSNNSNSNNRNNTSSATAFKISDNFISNKVNNSSVNSCNTTKFNTDENDSEGTVANFANFDDNPIFNNGSVTTTSSPFTGMNNISENKRAPLAPPPSEDRYAALKDLDCLMKSQMVSSSSSASPASDTANKNNWGETTVVWPPSSVFEQQSTAESDDTLEKASNPFSPKTENGWSNMSFVGNPFKTENVWPTSNSYYPNGTSGNQSINFNKSIWENGQIHNPFFINSNIQNTAGHHSGNPFL